MMLPSPIYLKLSIVSKACWTGWPHDLSRAKARITWHIIWVMGKRLRYPPPAPTGVYNHPM